MLNLKNGNLLKDDAEALVNTVNTKGVMGKGIALQFKQAYPAMYKLYEKDAKSGEITIGKIHVYDNGALADGPRWILNFPTKNHWRSKSKITDIEAGLQDLAEKVKTLNIKSIAMPPLGCGLGGLRWEDVLPLIEKHLGNLEGVETHIYPPSESPSAKSAIINTKKPKMTKSSASIILLIDKYLAGQLAPFITLLEIHKLTYFLQESGLDLKLKFEPKSYGPYAKNLRHVLIRMDGHYLEGYGDGYDKPSKPLNLKEGAIEEAEDFLKSDPQLLERLELIAYLIEGFEDPYGLELLSTVYWVKSKQHRVAEEEIISSIHSWNNRKKNTMKVEHIIKANSHLEHRNLL